MEGYLSRVSPHRHKWRLRHSLGDGFQPFEPTQGARALTTPPSQGGKVSIEYGSTYLDIDKAWNELTLRLKAVERD